MKMEGKHQVEQKALFILLPFHVEHFWFFFILTHNKIHLNKICCLMQIKYRNGWPWLLSDFVNYGFKWFSYFQNSNLSPKDVDELKPNIYFLKIEDNFKRFFQERKLNILKNIHINLHSHYKGITESESWDVSSLSTSPVSSFLLV